MKKFWLISFLILVCVFTGINSVEAQQSLPEGGDSFETATLIQPGKYQAGPLNEEVGLEKYYSLQGKAGQEVKIQGVFKAESATYGTTNRIVLYNESEEELFDVGGPNSSSLTLSASWLSNSNQSVYKYYLKVADEGLWHTQSFTLEIFLVERYDAGSQTDAGDALDKALIIVAPGKYQGYLAGCYDCLSFDVREGGIDFKDFYKISVKKGQTLTVTATPSPEAKIELGIYNTKRQLVKREIAKNAGAIVATSLDVINDGDVFAAVICEEDCSSKLVAYTLDITTTALPEEKPVIGEEGTQPPSEKPEIGGILPAEEPGEEEKIPEVGPGLIPGMMPEIMKELPYQHGFSPLMFFKWGVWYSLLLIVLYVYFALCLQLIAKKTSTPNAWLAWIPIANIFLFLQVAQKPLWWFILILIPIVNIVIGIILWMKVAERRSKPSWLGILVIVPIVGIIIPGYLAFSNSVKGKDEGDKSSPGYLGGSEEANKPTVGYKHPCRYCEKLIPPDSRVCPFCGKENPLGPMRCPKCHNPVEKDWRTCSHCGLELRIICPHCGKTTFFGDYCEDCGARLLVKCPHCGQEQPSINDNCIKCGQPLKRSSK